MGQRKKLNSDVVAMETSVKSTRNSGAWLACKGVSRWIEETSLLYLHLNQLLEMGYPLKDFITLSDTGPLWWGQFWNRDSAINFSSPNALKLRKWVPGSWSRNMMAPAFTTPFLHLESHTFWSPFPSLLCSSILITKINDHLLFLSWFDHPRLEKVSTTWIPLWHHNRSSTQMISSIVQAY